MKTHATTQRLNVFNFHGQDIRVLVVNGEPKWVGSDLASALEYCNAANAFRSLGNRHKEYFQVTTPAGPRRMVVLDKSALDHLFLRSGRANVEELKNWIEKEVIPALFQDEDAGSVAGAQQARELTDDFEALLVLALQEVRRRKAAEARIAVLEAEKLERDR